MIYAYYPYQEDINFNARQIPAKLAPNALETDDYMYGTHAIGQKAVNSTSPLVLLSMNHAPIAYIFPAEPKQRQDRCLYYKFRSSRK